MTRDIGKRGGGLLNYVLVARQSLGCGKGIVCVTLAPKEG